MMTVRSLGRIAFLALICSSANATEVFDFTGDASGTSTTFTDTVNGLSATFFSAGDPGGFVVSPSNFATLTGNVLGDPGPASQDNLTLNVGFSSNLQSVSLNFATADFGNASPFTLSAYENSTLVGTVSAVGSVPDGYFFPEGTVSFSGADFNQINLSSTSSDFEVGDIAADTASPVPLPDALPLLVSGCLGFGLSTLKLRARRGVKAV